jgi:pyruvate formate lyase activating enzyme
VRTTVHSDLLRVEEINRIIKDLLKRGYSGTYYLQPFVFTEHTIGRVKEEKNPFDISQLSHELEVIWRS